MKYVMMAVIVGALLAACKGSNQDEQRMPSASVAVVLDGNPETSVLHQAISAREVFLRAIAMAAGGREFDLQPVFKKNNTSAVDVLGQSNWRVELTRLRGSSTARHERLRTFQEAFSRKDIGVCSSDCVSFPVSAGWVVGTDKANLSSPPCFGFVIDTQRYVVCPIRLSISGADDHEKNPEDTPIRGVPRSAYNYVIAVNVDSGNLALWWGDRLYFSRSPDVDLAATALLGEAMDMRRSSESSESFKLPLTGGVLRSVTEDLTQAAKIYSEEQGPDGAPLAWQRLYPAESRCAAEGPRQFVQEIQAQSLEATTEEQTDPGGTVVRVIVKAPATGITGTFFRGHAACLRGLAEVQAKLRKLN